jgi:hypothetical protein
LEGFGDLNDGKSELEIRSKHTPCFVFVSVPDIDVDQIDGFKK